jgi:LysR family glycine cleavage system transcriptional activator
MESRNGNLSLRGLRTFCVAAEHESFRDAADRLFITASAVSHQIRNLEEELGIRLFERLSRSIELTEAGRALYADLQPVIGELDTIARRHRRAATRSVLRISVQPFFASELFVPNLSKFTEMHPDIDILVDTSDESSAKHPAGADVSIRVFGKPPKSLVSHRLFALRLIPASSAEFRDRIVRRRNRIVSPFPLIVHASRPDAWQRWEQESGIEIPRNAQSVRLDSMIAVARAAERGLGAALVPVQLSDSWFESGALVPLFSHELPTEDAYYFVSRQDDADDPNVRLFRDWVLQEFDDDH